MDQITIERYDKSVQAFRDIAKYIVTLYAGVAAILLAGLQLSDIGKVQGIYLVIASLGFIVVLACVWISIWKVVEVLRSGGVTVETMKDYGKIKKYRKGEINLNDIAFTGRYGSIEKFCSEHERITREYYKKKKLKNGKKIKELDEEVEDIGSMLKDLLFYTRYALVVRTFNSAMRWLMACGIMAALGIGVFSWAAGQGAREVLVIGQPPEKVRMTLTSAGKETLREALGENCVNQESIDVMLLEYDEKEIDVVIIPSKVCSSYRFKLTQEIGDIEK